MKERIKAKKFTVQDLNQFYALHRNSVGKIVDKEDIRLRYGFSKDEYDSLLMFFNTPQVNDTSNGTSSTSTGSLKSVWVEN